MPRITAAILVVCNFLITSGASALDVPPLTGRIVDLAHIVPPDLAASLTEQLAEHERRTSNQVAVLTIPTLAGEPLEEYSHRVATTWKLGQKGTDNGVLILVVPNDRRARIEVGYGLEGVLTDAMSSRIIRDEMVPHFRNADYGAGVAAGVRAVLGTIEGTYTPRPARGARGGDGIAHSVLVAVIVGAFVGVVFSGLQKAFGVLGGGLLAFMMTVSAGLLVGLAAAVLAILVTLVLSALTRGGGHLPGGGYYGDGWSGGGYSSGDTFSGGGGDFGGGGASGRW